MSVLRFLTFAGSTRAGSLNAKLAAAVTKALALEDQDVTQISLADYQLPLFDEDYEKAEGVPKAAVVLARLITSAHGVFISSPEYNSSITPLLKNTLDWVSRVLDADGKHLPVFRNKAVALGSAAPGHFGGIRALGHVRQIMEIGMGGLVIPQQVIVPNAGSAFDDQGALKDQRAHTMLMAMVARLIREAENASRVS